MNARSRLCLLAVSSVFLVTAVLNNDASAQNASLDCSTLSKWTKKLDQKDRWYPIEGNKGLWLPALFNTGSFAEVFGKPPFEMTKADRQAVVQTLTTCAKAAGKEKRYDDQKALNGAKGFLGSRLEVAQKQVAKAGGVSTGQNKSARRQTTSGTPAAPATSASSGSAIRCKDLSAWNGKLDPNDRWYPTEANRKLWLPAIFNTKEFEGIFGKPALSMTGPDKLAASQTISLCAKAAGKEKRYDEQKALNGSKFYWSLLDSAQTAMASAGRTRDGGSFEQNLENLLARPTSEDLLTALDALRDLDPGEKAASTKAYGRVSRIGNPEGQLARAIMLGVASKPSGTMDQSVRPPVQARYQEVRVDLLRQLETQIAEFSNDANGLKDLEAKRQAIRTGLADALEEADVASLEATADEKRAQIQGAMVAVAKGRIDTAPKGPQGIAAIKQIVNEVSVAGITVDQAGEVREFAKDKQRVLANDILRQAVGEFGRFPDTLAGMGELNRFAQKVSLESGGHAEQSVKQQFSSAINRRLSDQARAALPEFKAQLAALPNNAAGLAEAEKRLKGVRFWVQLDDKVRGSYAAAAKRRRDEIAAIVEAEQIKRRQAVIAAGGDPELVGYKFIDRTTGTVIEFRDQSEASVSVIGIPFAAPYEVKGDNVVIRGPNGKMFLTRNGDTLNGMGMSLRRVQ